jgi:protein phosphatase
MTQSNTTLVVNAFGQSDIGLVRENNEDSFLISDLTTDAAAPDGGELGPATERIGTLLLVADGMGGAKAGEVASRMAVESIEQNFFADLRSNHEIDQPSFVRILKAAIEEANRLVFEEAQRDGNLKGMGTTLTAAAIHGTSIFFAQLGDSRGYLVRNGCITQMTQDQSLVAQLVASGAIKPEEAKGHPRRNVILQALGIKSEVDIVVSYASLRRHDRVVLCSDGLSAKVEPEEVNEILHKWANPKDACQRLVELARERGGQDNITVIVACFDGEALPLAEPGSVATYNKFGKDGRRRHFWPWMGRQKQ